MSDPTPPPAAAWPQFPCRHCGASLVFAPGQHALQCPYCGTLNQIAADVTPVQELDYAAELRAQSQQQDTHETVTVHCDGCGAESQLPRGMTAGVCPFCGRPMVATAQSSCRIKPRALLPFTVDRDRATPQFAAWLNGLWFAPAALRAAADRGRLAGVYLPAWTYDCRTSSVYTGSRGDHYWETETYTETINGQTETRTRQVQRTRWSSAGGAVRLPFDDVLVIADRSLPEKLRCHLGDWDLQHLCPYRDDYLSGFVAETYQVSLSDGFEAAKALMAGPIRRAINSDIGGDEQRIASVDTRYVAITFKHVLLPVWISAYRFNEKTYHYVINGRSGRVYGERPYSAMKILLTVLLGFVLAAIITFAVRAFEAR